MCSFNQQITECQGLLLAGGRPPAVQQAASRKGGAIPMGGAIPKRTESSRIPGADRWYKCWGFSEPWHRAWHPVDTTKYWWNRLINELKKKKRRKVQMEWRDKSSQVRSGKAKEKWPHAKVWSLKGRARWWHGSIFESSQQAGSHAGGLL